MMSRISVSLLVLSLVLSSACSERAEPRMVWVLDGALPTNLDAVEQALSIQRTSLQFDGGQTVENCHAYLKALEDSQVQAVTSERRTEREYLSCEALARLKALAGEGATLRSDPLKRESISLELCNKLDMNSFSHSLRPQMTEGMHTVSDVLQVRPIDEKNCKFDIDSRVFELKPVVQFQSGTSSDQYLVVWLSDQITDGTYTDYQSLLIKTTPAGNWKALDEWPRPL